jgi:hypothetical protein
MWQYSIFGSEYLGLAKFLWRIFCPFQVKMCFWGEMMQNHHNKARRHGIREFTVMDMGGGPCHQPNSLKLIMVH